MKILVFSPFYPPHIGGLESHSDEFNKHLASRSVEITVFTPQLPVDAPKKETRYENVRIIRFPAVEIIHNYPLPKFWLPEFWNLLSQAGSDKPDIVISRTRFFSTSLFALLYAKLRHTPILHIEHGSDYTTFNSSFKTALGKLYDHTLGWVVLRFADRIVANSTASADFVKHLSGRDATVIYRGVETEKILAIPPDSCHSERVFEPRNLPIETQIPRQARDDNTKNKTLIGYVGRLIDGKGVADLLLALEKLDRDDFVCHIVGDGPERGRLEKTTTDNSRLAERIRFHGHLEHDRAIAVMRACDIFVNPSYGEGMPTSVTEAALCGKAIVATRVGGTPEIITGKDDGFLIPSGAPDILAEKIGFLLDHPDKREQFGRNAHDEVLGKFSWDRAAGRYLEVFSDLLENKKE